MITNKASRFVRPHLAQAGIESYFRLVIGGDDLPVKKPHPGPLLHAAREFGVEPAKLLMVGDSGNDAQAARAAGCPVLIVPYGYNEGTPVQNLDADGIVDSLLAVADRRAARSRRPMSFDSFLRNGHCRPGVVASHGLAPLAPLAPRARGVRACIDDAPRSRTVAQPLNAVLEAP